MNTSTITPSDSAIDGLLPVTNSDGLPLIRDRIGNVKEAYAIYQSMVQAAYADRLNRIKIQMRADGVPPYPERELIKRGLVNVANVNFGWMADALELANAPYLDLINGVEELWRLPITYGDDPEQQKDWQGIIELEMTWLITQMESFDYDFNSVCHQFILHGLSVPYFPNDKDISWTTGSVADFLIPRHIRAKESAIEVACAEQFYLPHELFQCIEDPEIAKEHGWNPAQTWEIIKAARTDIGYYENIERQQEDWKNNDYQLSARSKEIRVIHMWVKSLNGKMSHYMFDADGLCKDFMYKSLDKFEQQSQAFTIFTYGVGANEFYHGTRGLGYKIFALVKEMDELWSAFLDALRMSGKMVIKPEREADLKKLAVTYFGHYIVMPPNANIQAFQMPDLSRTMMPGLNVLGGLLQQKSANYISPDNFNQKQMAKLKALAARMDEVANLSVSRINCFYKSFLKLSREQVRRVIRKDWHETDPCYAEVMEFYSRCKDQGVPEQAIRSIDLKKMQVVRAIGAGSKAARQLMMDELRDDIAKCDEDGQYQFLRDSIRTKAGVEAANRYAPRKKGLRPPQDQGFADLENSIMALGQPPAFEPNQLHPVHVKEHLKKLGEMIKESEEAVEQAAAAQKEVGIEAFQSAPAMKAIYDHIEQHMEAIPEKLPDGTDNPVRAELNQTYQQTGEAVNNNLKHFERLSQQQKGGQGQGGAPGTPSPDEQASIAADERARKAIDLEQDQAKFQQKLAQEQAEHELKIKHRMDEHALELKLKAEKDAQERAAYDAKTAAEVASKVPQPPL